MAATINSEPDIAIKAEPSSERFSIEITATALFWCLNGSSTEPGKESFGKYRHGLTPPRFVGTLSGSGSSPIIVRRGTVVPRKISSCVILKDLRRIRPRLVSSRRTIKSRRRSADGCFASDPRVAPGVLDPPSQLGRRKPGSTTTGDRPAALSHATKTAQP